MLWRRGRLAIHVKRGDTHRSSLLPGCNPDGAFGQPEVVRRWSSARAIMAVWWKVAVVVIAASGMRARAIGRPRMCTATLQGWRAIHLHRRHTWAEEQSNRASTTPRYSTPAH